MNKGFFNQQALIWNSALNIITSFQHSLIATI